MKKNRGLILALMSLTLLSACGGSSGGGRTPTDNTVTPTSCTHCYLFMSNTTTTGNLGGVTGADTICNNDTSKPNSGTYKALLLASTRNQNTNWVLKANQAYYRPDEVLIGTTNASKIFALDTGYLNNNTDNSGFDYMWTGITTTSDTVWTTGANCSNWTVGSSGTSGLFGDSASVDRISMGESSNNCSDPTFRLYCVEQ